MQANAIKKVFLEVLLRAKRKYRFKVTNFCIMSNHIHLMVTPGEGESLSRIMQWVLSVFAIQYNRRCGLQGHVWYDRFKSKIVDGLRNFLHAFRYIAENPVKAGLAHNAWEYPYGGVFFLKSRNFHIVEKPSLTLLLYEPALCRFFPFP